MTAAAARRDVESPYAWARLGVALLLMTIGGVGMHGVVVALPPVQAEFGATRSAVSLSYALTMIGLGLGSLMMGRISDRYGAMVPVLISAVSEGLGFIAAGSAETLWQFALAHGVLIGFLGVSGTFAPLVADISHWFTRNRGMAVSICICGSYLGGAVWPPVMQYFFDGAGWRATYIGVGWFCLATQLLLALALRRRSPQTHAAEPPPAGLGAGSGAVSRPASGTSRPLGFSPGGLQALLCVAGISCCAGMAMPQVHIVAMCGDLGYAAARGAEMLSLMLGFGIVSRLASGWLADRIGGLKTLLLGSALQAIALALFLPWSSLGALYAASAVFGLVQGGLVPSYPIIIREYFAPREAGARVGAVLTATTFGMALGGWMSGAVFDMTGSYRVAFVNGMVWSLVTVAIAVLLLRRANISMQSSELAASPRE